MRRTTSQTRWVDRWSAPTSAARRTGRCSTTTPRYDKEYPGNDDFTQPGNLFRLMPADARERLIGNLVDHMGPVKQEIQERQIRHFHKADPAYGEGVAKGLGLDIDAIVAE